MGDVLIERIEQIQRWSFLRIGVAPDQIPAKIISLKHRKRKYSWDHENGYDSDADGYRQVGPDPSMDETYRRFGTTMYQDPIILRGLAEEIDKVEAQAHHFSEVLTDRAADPGPPQRFVLASIPLFTLNGFCIESSNEYYGIILQDGLRFTPRLLMDQIGKFLFTVTSEGIGLNFSEDGVKSWLLQKPAHTVPIIDIFVKDVAGPGTLLPRGPRSVSDELLGSQLVAEFGFKFIVLAHEFAHCVGGHFDQLRGCPRRGWIVRNEAVRTAVMRYISEEFSEVPKPSQAMLQSFMVTHALELEADELAFRMLIEDLLIDDPLFGPKCVLKLLGAMLFYWYVEFSERVHRTLEFGRDWYRNPLYKNEILNQWTQDLYFRPTHPAPLERLSIACLRVLEEYKEHKQIVAAINGVGGFLDAYFETVWADNAEFVAQYVKDKNLSLAKKWTWQIDDLGLKIGIR